jgi:homocitrate synthase NifV
MLIDSTLREGEQCYGAYFTLQAKTDILRRILAVGVEELEIACVGAEDAGLLLETAREHARNTKISLWCRARREDVERAAELGIRRVNMGVPASDKHGMKRLGLSRADILKLVEDVVGHARACDMEYISVGLEDVSRADRAFALELAQAIQQNGAHRVRLSDTVGVLTPLETAGLVGAFREGLSCDVAVHLHDDFGMATANAVTALAAGADYADVSVLGIGERAGISKLEEVATHLALREGYEYDLSQLKELCALIAEAGNITLPRNKAVVGRDVFACETGLHVHGLLKDPSLFEPFDPAAVGAKRSIGIGKKSGRAAVAAAAREMGREISSEELSRMTRAARTLAREKGRPLEAEEVQELLRKAG